ncbi:MAG: Tm-1-like ATP-binding domain-containing protein [Bacillota bacterium]|nr:Tm-1-like ATP-binding domain-containing protein [Bacillota bacterium]
MKKSKKMIVVIATLDTKSSEAKYLKDLISERGHTPIVIDVGIFGKHSFDPDFNHEAVAEAAGSSVQDVQNCKGEGEAISIMARGASKIVNKQADEGRVDGLVSIGGSMGTSLGLAVMQSLPVKIPKLMLSSIAFTPMVTPGSVSIDQVMMQTIGDLWGLNRITKMALQRAAGAICGMVEAQKEEEKEEKGIIAITTLGVHSYVDYCKPLLLEKGYEPVVFHAVGTNACEKLVRDGYLKGLLDLAIYELVNFVCGGAISGGEEKIKAACEKGIPQVIAPGALDFFTWTGTIDSLPLKFQKRNIHMHNPLVLLVQTSSKEKQEIARLIVERVNKTKGPTVLLVPLKGFSSLDTLGKPFYDPEAGKKFAGVMHKGITNNLVEIVELNLHINDPLFGERAAQLLLDKMQ